MHVRNWYLAREATKVARTRARSPESSPLRRRTGASLLRAAVRRSGCCGGVAAGDPEEAAAAALGGELAGRTRIAPLQQHTTALGRRVTFSQSSPQCTHFSFAQYNHCSHYCLLYFPPPLISPNVRLTSTRTLGRHALKGWRCVRVCAHCAVKRRGEGRARQYGIVSCPGRAGPDVVASRTNRKRSGGMQCPVRARVWFRCHSTAVRT